MYFKHLTQRLAAKAVLVLAAVTLGQTFGTDTSHASIVVQPVEIDLTLTFIPQEPIIPPSPITQLTGTGFLGTPNPLLIGGETVLKNFDIGTLNGSNPAFTLHFIPVDPCVGGGTCRIDFSFGGTASSFPAFGFETGNVPSTSPGSPPIIPIGMFIPVEPCFTGGRLSR